MWFLTMLYCSPTFLSLLKDPTHFVQIAWAHFLRHWDPKNFWKLRCIWLDHTFWSTASAWKMVKLQVSHYMSFKTYQVVHETTSSPKAWQHGASKSHNPGSGLYKVFAAIKQNGTWAKLKRWAFIFSDFSNDSCNSSSSQHDWSLLTNP